MSKSLPQSILFCCDHNAVRSPMAEGIMKKLFGTGTYVQSVGVINDLEIDGFSIAVCEEIDVELSRHRARSFDEMEQWGDNLSSFDLIVALSPASQRRALELTRLFVTLAKVLQLDQKKTSYLPIAPSHQNFSIYALKAQHQFPHIQLSRNHRFQDH